MAHHGSGVVLKTSFDQKENRVLRTIFDKKYICYRTINDYVPPIFLVVNYEEAAFSRDCFVKTTTATADENLKDVFENNRRTEDDASKTDEVFNDNMKFVESLLSAAECGYDTSQVTFLRLETIRDFQRSFETLYPLWNVGMGALVRLSFATWYARTKALKVLASNAANNRDVYTIHYAANTSAVTIVDYLEPLFAYCVKKTKADGHDTEYCTSSTSGPKKASLSAATVTNEMFEINFCIVDEPPTGDRYTSFGPVDTNPVGPRRNAMSVHSAVADSVIGSTASKKGGRKKRDVTSDNASCVSVQADESADSNWPSRGRRESAVLEKQRTMCGPLSVHDVRPYFSILNSKRLTRISLEQLEELPVVTIRCDPDFSSTTCCIIDRTDNQLTILHVYYCWDQNVHTFLTTFANLANDTNRRHNNRTLVSVSPLCSEDVEARFDMLRDLKNVIWKDNMNAYLRLAIDNSYDSEMVARFFYEPLVFHVQRSTADLETEIKGSVASSSPSGSIDMFRNAITLDCSRVCRELDPKTCRFAQTYYKLIDDTTFSCNGSLRLKSQTVRENVSSRNAAMKLLERGQNLCARLVSEFRSERILDTAFDIVSDLRIGLLDAFGLSYTDRHQRFPKQIYRDDSAYGTRSSRLQGSRSCDDPVLSSSIVANAVFLDTLLNSSVYTGLCASVSQYNEFFTEEKKVKPLSQFVHGLYNRGDILDFDLESAYPTITALYNISPETTAIVDRQTLKRFDETLNAYVISDKTRSQHTNINSTNIMTSFYNQVGHVNETNSNLVIVSLRPEIHVGVLSRFMERLVLKRKARNETLRPFYKRFANFVYGSTGKADVFNDLFAPQCASAIRSLCKSIMIRTLQNLPSEYVLLTQTDGALLYTGPSKENADTTAPSADCSSKMTCGEIEAVISQIIRSITSDIGNTTASIQLVPRLRSADVCLLVDQNRYLMMFTDGTTVCKGPDGSNTTGTQRYINVMESLLTLILTFIRDDLDIDGNPAVVLNRFLLTCLNHLGALNAENLYDWRVTICTPSSSDILYSETNQLSIIGIRLGEFLKNERPNRIADTSLARFGDTISVWPVLVNNNGEVSREYRMWRPIYNNTVKPNYVFVMKNALWYWVKCLFCTCFKDQDEVILNRMFHAICYKYENELMVTGTTGTVVAS